MASSEASGGGSNAEAVSSKRKTRVKSEMKDDSDELDNAEDFIDFQIRLKCDPEFFPEGTDWSTQTYFNCYLCGIETDGFRSSVDHLRSQHPEALTRDKNAPCIWCV